MDMSIKLNTRHTRAATGSPGPVPAHGCDLRPSLSRRPRPAPPTGMPPERAALEKAVTDMQEFVQAPTSATWTFPSMTPPAK
jgi:flagellar protein FlaG